MGANNTCQHMLGRHGCELRGADRCICNHRLGMRHLRGYVDFHENWICFTTQMHDGHTSLVISSFDKPLLPSTCINSSCTQSANEIQNVQWTPSQIPRSGISLCGSDKHSKKEDNSIGQTLRRGWVETQRHAVWKPRLTVVSMLTLSIN